jgi:hypothetical protein
MPESPVPAGLCQNSIHLLMYDLTFRYCWELMKCFCGDFSAISLDMLGTDEVSKDVKVATTTIHFAVEVN